MDDIEVYEFKIRDIKYVDFKTGGEKIIGNSVEYQFDVSINGEYVIFKVITL